MLLIIVKSLLLLTIVGCVSFAMTGCVSLNDNGVNVNNNVKKGNSEWQTFPTYNR